MFKHIRRNFPTLKLSVHPWLQPLRSIFIPLDRLLLPFRSKQTTLDPYLQAFKHYRQQKYFYQLL